MSNYNLYPCFEHWKERGSIYIYSDPHFSDEEMKYLRKNYIGDDEQIKRINSCLSANDTIIFLGDIGNIECIQKIKGYKVLILGNHDKGASCYKRAFSFVSYYDDVDSADKAMDSREINYWRVADHKVDHAIEGLRDNKLFDEVYKGPVLINEKILLSHEPVEFKYAFNIHGHDHSEREFQDNVHLNVCAEVIDYKPINLKHIVESGMLKPVINIHRDTIDQAIERGKDGK